MKRTSIHLGVLLCAVAACPSDGDGDGDSSTPMTGGIASVSGTATDVSGTDAESMTATTMVEETDGDTDGSSSSDGELNCGESEFVLQAVPPNVMLVLDKSGSMVQNEWDADADAMTPDVTRWESLHNVVDFVVNNFNQEINFGALLFPSEAAVAQLGEGACVVGNNPQVPVSVTNAAQVLDGIPGAGATNIQGATPATSGVQVAREHLLTLDPTIDRFMILITDGAANCSADADTSMCPGPGCGLMEDYDANLPIEVGAAFNDDEIPTYVIGIDIIDALVGEEPDDGQVGANTFEELNLVAESGGRAREGDEKFFNATNEIELMEALAEIAGQVVSCTIPLNPEPDAPRFVEIEINGEVIPSVENCESEDGWVYVNPEGPFDAIELCNSACDALAESGELDATYGCPPSG